MTPAPNSPTVEAGDATAALTLEGFIDAVADIEIHDEVGGSDALNYAVVNTLHGRGSLDKTTRRTVATAIRTLQAVIRDARSLQDARLAAALQQKDSSHG